MLKFGDVHQLLCSVSQKLGKSLKSNSHQLIDLLLTWKVQNK